MRTVALSLCLLVGALALTSVAAAQPAPAPSDDARAQFEAGKKAFRLGDYDEAIRAWREGYRLKGDPKFLYNLGQAYREKGDLEQAVHFLRSYLKEDKDAPNREAVETRIHEMEALIAARDAEKTKPPTGPVDADGSEESAPARERDDVPRGGKGLKIAGIATGGAGLVLIGTGIFFRLRAASAEDEISDATAAGRPWDADLQATDDRGRRAATLSPIFLGVGAGALVAGGVLFYLGTRASGSRSETALVPTVGADGAGVLVRGRF